MRLTDEYRQHPKLNTQDEAFPFACEDAEDSHFLGKYIYSN